MTIADDRYRQLMTTLTDMHQHSPSFAIMGRAWIESEVQGALCAADVYPESSDRDYVPHANRG